MKKHIDKSCLQGNNVITLIKHFIKHNIKQYKKEEIIMLQQVMTNPGEIIFREVPVPEVKENQVLVKIMNIGICGSDIQDRKSTRLNSSHPNPSRMPSSA